MQSLTRRSFDWILAIMLCLVILKSLAIKRKLIFLESHSVRRCEMRFTSYGSVVHPGSHWLRSSVFLIHTFVKSSGTLIGDRILCSNVLLLDMRLNCLRHNSIIARRFLKVSFWCIRRLKSGTILYKLQSRLGDQSLIRASRILLHFILYYFIMFLIALLCFFVGTEFVLAMVELSAYKN